MTEPSFTLSEAELRALATEIKADPLSFDPSTIRKATVTAVSLATSPPTVTIQLSGDTTVSIDSVRVMKSYTPAVNDTALILKQGNELLAIGMVATSSYGLGTLNYARYSRSSTFSCAHNTIEKVVFTASDLTDGTMITQSGLQDFSTVKAGIFQVVVNLPWAANATGSRWGVIGASGSSSTRWAVLESSPSNGSAVPQNLTMTRRFLAGAGISVYAYQDSGAALTLFPTTSTGPLDISFTYLGP